MFCMGDYICKENLFLSGWNSSIWYCRSTSAYFLYLRVIPRRGSGLILRCCKILQKTKNIEHRNDVICRKIIDSAGMKKIHFCLQ